MKQWGLRDKIRARKTYSRYLFIMYTSGPQPFDPTGRIHYSQGCWEPEKKLINKFCMYSIDRLFTHCNSEQISVRGVINFKYCRKMLEGKIKWI